MGVRGLLIATAFFASLVVVCYAEIKLSQLPVVLDVTVTNYGGGQVPGNLKAGEVQLVTVTWVLNKTRDGVDTSKYGKVAVKLCYRKESQIDRPWRKTEDELFKDKTCAHDIDTRPYSATENLTNFIVTKDVPTGHYFVRAYILDASGAKIAYGEDKNVDLSVTSITGRNASIEIAAADFSTFSVVSLAFFFYLEKKKSKSVA